MIAHSSAMPLRIPSHKTEGTNTVATTIAPPDSTVVDIGEVEEEIERDIIFRATQQKLSGTNRKITVNEEEEEDDDDRHSQASTEAGSTRDDDLELGPNGQTPSLLSIVPRQQQQTELVGYLLFVLQTSYNITD